MASQQPDPGPVADGQPVTRLAVPGNERDAPLSGHVTVRFPEDLAAAARRLAEQDGMTASAWVRRIVDRELAARPADGAPRLRPGDQQLPVPNDGPSMHDLVITDLGVWTVPHREAVQDLLLKRKRVGFERYGSYLQSGNKRDWWRDLAEELADAAVYAKQGICELGDDAPAELGQVYRLILRALSRAVKIPEDGRG
jgi:hypothetical protein